MGLSDIKTVEKVKNLNLEDNKKFVGELNNLIKAHLNIPSDGRMDEGERFEFHSKFEKFKEDWDIEFESSDLYDIELNDFKTKKNNIKGFLNKIAYESVDKIEKNQLLLTFLGAIGLTTAAGVNGDLSGSFMIGLGILSTVTYPLMEKILIETKDKFKDNQSDLIVRQY